MSLIIAAGLLSFALQGAGDTPPAVARLIPAAALSPSASESAGAARAWLALVDGQQWDQSWSTAGAVFKSQVAQARWASLVQPLRQQYGPVASRVLQSVVKANALPGAPAGQYEILQFATNFAQKPDAIETVILAHESSGWRVVGYFIK